MTYVTVFKLLWHVPCEEQDLDIANHSNIRTIDEIGKQGDQSSIATAYLEGLTLKHRVGGKCARSLR